MPRWDNALEAHSRVSNINLDLRDPMHIRKKLLKEGKVVCHLGFKSKVLPGPLPDLSV